MRFYLEMELEQPEMVRDFRRTILSYIKQTLSKSNDGKYLEQYYKDTQQKDFAFNVVFRAPSFKGEKILLEENRIQIHFSTDQRSKTGLRLMNAFLMQRNMKFPLPDGNSMALRRIVEEKRKEITNSKVIFKTQTGGGLCIREHIREKNKDKYYTVEDQGFIEQGKLVLKNQAIAAGFSERVAGNIEFVPIECRKVLAKHYDVFVDLTVGTFEMEGDSRLLQYFYDAGIGSRKSEGFAMVDLITQDLA